ncbi:DNA recombination protein RmuC [Rhodopila sp.]|uniref:DNA recombination protein RmuC n=1 Tax=Rhodopila sp. TaxID=2480087 RepID=UPI003D0FA1A0
MTLEILAELAIIVMVAALLGTLVGHWFGGRRRSADPAMMHQFQGLSTLVEQSGKATRQDVDSLRKAMTDTERVLGAKIDEGLRSGFDRSLATINDGAKVQTAQIDTFRTEIAAVLNAMTRLGTEVPAALETAGAKAKLDAIDASRLLLNGLTAGLHQHGLDQGLKIEAFGAKVEASGAAVLKALAEFQMLLTERLGDVRLAVTRIGGEMTTTLAENQGKTAKALTEDFSKLIVHVDAKIIEMREGNEAKLLQIQGIVDQKLQEGIEKRMTENFAKITTQFAEVQQAVGEVKTVAGQVGDLKRLFSNVKSRGGWGEAQVKATLDDILPPGSYETNMRINPATSDMVEFALRLPVQGGSPVYLAIDAKFPVEDYTRFLEAIEVADAVAEKAAKSALEGQIRLEARKIQTKYIAPPHTAEWAILYLPSEGLYAEVTRNGELMEAIHRDNRVIIMGPSMLAVMLRTIQLGHYTLAISQKADLIGKILGAVKHEMVDFGKQFSALEKNVRALGNNIKKGQTRATVITRKLKDVAALEGPAAAALLEIAQDGEDDADADLEAVE